MTYDTVLLLSGLMGLGLLCIWGPFALLLHFARYPNAAAILGGSGIWLGILWFAHVSTYLKWLGVLPVLCGVLALWLTAKRL